MKKVLLVLVTVALLTSCGKSLRSAGGEVTGVRSVAFNEPAPYGMVLVKRGSFEMRLRDSYADAAGDDEYAGKDLRIAVVRAMLADGQGAAAEDFFFAHCQGKVGDADCAMLIAGHYKAKKDAVALDAFVGKVSLRYDSDTQKVKSLTK